MATARFVLVLVLLAFGCALLIASFRQEPAAAVVLVGGRVHAATVVFFSPAGYSTGFKNHEPA